MGEVGRNAWADLPLPAVGPRAVPRGIKVEMVAVKAVRIWPQNGAKWPTSCAPHLAKRVAVTATVPAIENSHFAPVSKTDTRDINRATKGVFG